MEARKGGEGGLSLEGQCDHNEVESQQTGEVHNSMYSI